MDEQYNPKKIEENTQHFWEENNAFQETEDVNKEKYFSYGALFYAKSIDALELTGKTYYKQFTDITYKPTENTRFQYIEEHNARFNAGKIMVQAKNKNTNQIETITLIPFGKTILRQVSF